MTLAYQMFLICCVHALEVNVAFNKTASTTSEIYSNWYPSGAVDGDHTKLNDPSSCFHAATSPADWTVDLGQEYQLYNIIVYLRTRSWVRTANSSIYLDNSSRVCYTFPSTISDNPTRLTCNGTGRYVTIRNPGTEDLNEDSLNICEVEIYACSISSYGKACNFTCHCSFCDRWTGICTGECKAGWRGIRCDIACNGTYGVNCNKSCDERKCSSESLACDVVNGTCEAGCLPGWNGTDCTKECASLTYGENCVKDCADRHCAGNSSCHHVTGSCDQSCTAGWMGLDCLQECESSYYGENCTNSCAERHCAGNSSCDHLTGSCDKGCESGWGGQACRFNYQSPEGTPDLTSAVVGLSTALLVVIIVAVVIISVLCWKIRRKTNGQGRSPNLATIKENAGGSNQTPVTDVYTEASSPDIDGNGHTTSESSVVETRLTYDTLQKSGDNLYTDLKPKTFYENI